MQEDMQRPRHLLLRSGAIVQDAEKRNVPSLAMLQQLKGMRDETFRGHYVLDVVRCRAALGRPGDSSSSSSRHRDVDDGGEAKAKEREAALAASHCRGSTRRSASAFPHLRRHFGD
jgi:hypothetical protein